MAIATWELLDLDLRWNWLHRATRIFDTIACPRVGRLENFSVAPWGQLTVMDMNGYDLAQNLQIQCSQARVWAHGASNSRFAGYRSVRVKWIQPIHRWMGLPWCNCLKNHFESELMHRSLSNGRSKIWYFDSKTIFFQLATGAGESAPPSSLFSRVFRAASSAVSSPLQWTSEFARFSGSIWAQLEEIGGWKGMYVSILFPTCKPFFFVGGVFLMVFELSSLKL